MLSAQPTFRFPHTPRTHKHTRSLIEFRFAIFFSFFLSPRPLFSRLILLISFSFSLAAELNFTRRDDVPFLSFFLSRNTKDDERRKKKRNEKTKEMFILMLCILILFMSYNIWRCIYPCVTPSALIILSPLFFFSFFQLLSLSISIYIYIFLYNMYIGIWFFFFFYISISSSTIIIIAIDRRNILYLCKMYILFTRGVDPSGFIITTTIFIITIIYSWLIYTLIIKQPVPFILYFFHRV